MFIYAIVNQKAIKTTDVQNKLNKNRNEISK